MDNDLPDDLLVVVEGTSERAYLRALDGRIAGLSAQRRFFTSAAHELSHAVLALNGASNTGVAGEFGALDLLIDLFGDLRSVNPLSGFTADAASPHRIVLPKHAGDSVFRLPPWGTRDVAGMLSEALRESGGTGASCPTARPQITFRLPDAIGSQLASMLATLLRAIHALLAMARLCELEVWMLRRERMRLLARIGRLPDIRAFVLVMIAVCQHYGHRSESHDHAPMFIRRHLVSMGSFPPI